MSKSKKYRGLIWAISKVFVILPVFFWLFLIFGFDEPSMAMWTIIAAIIHEAGHITYIMSKKKLRPNIRGVLSGFRIKTAVSLSYDEEIGVYLAGPLANLIFFVLFSILSICFGKNLGFAAIINLATALSNLLPIDGYDGYHALMTLIQKHELGDRLINALSHISSAIIFLFAVFSLYFIDRQNGGYWIFFIFFSSMIKCIRKSLGE